MELEKGQIFSVLFAESTQVQDSPNLSPATVKGGWKQ